MLSERNAQVEAEEDSFGRASVWIEADRLMRRLGSCPLRTHCWCDPHDKKHYKLSTHHLRSLVKLIQDGGDLTSQDDVPEDIQRQLYAEAEAASTRKRTARAILPLGMTLITVHDHFVEHPSGKEPSNRVNNTDLSKSVAPCVGSLLAVSGHLDTAARNHTEWQHSRFEDVGLKDEVAKACDVVLAEGLDLKKVYDDRDFQFLVDKGFRRGIAHRFVSDIKIWTKHSHCN